MSTAFADGLVLAWQGLGSGTVVVLRITTIVCVAWLLTRLLQRGVLALRMRVVSRIDDQEVAKRAETLGRVLRYVVAVVVGLVAFTLVLGEMGVSVAPILGAAGVVGLAVGFGAQSLVKDYFTGLFILLENQIRVGDVVDVGAHAGLVESVTLRHVQLRDIEGRVHFVPNGQIASVINLSRGHAYALIDVGVAYREELERVMALMRGVGASLAADPEFADRILEPMELLGVERWDNSAVVLRCRFKCKPLQQWGIRRAYLLRLKQAFDTAGVEIPFPHVTVYAGQDRDGRAPALPIALTRHRQVSGS